MKISKTIIIDGGTAAQESVRHADMLRTRMNAASIKLGDTSIMEWMKDTHSKLVGESYDGSYFNLFSRIIITSTSLLKPLTLTSANYAKAVKANMDRKEIVYSMSTAEFSEEMKFDDESFKVHTVVLNDDGVGMLIFERLS